MLSIGVLGDVMLGRGVARRLNQSAAPAVWGEALLALTASLDLVIANLECCLAMARRPTRRIARKRSSFAVRARRQRSCAMSLGAEGVAQTGVSSGF
jgi:hypothetical protein